VRDDAGRLVYRLHLPIDPIPGRRLSRDVELPRP